MKSVFPPGEDMIIIDYEGGMRCFSLVVMCIGITQR